MHHRYGRTLADWFLRPLFWPSLLGHEHFVVGDSMCQVKNSSAFKNLFWDLCILFRSAALHPAVFEHRDVSRANPPKNISNYGRVKKKHASLFRAWNWSSSCFWKDVLPNTTKGSFLKKYNIKTSKTTESRFSLTDISLFSVKQWRPEYINIEKVLQRDAALKSLAYH